MGCKQLPLPSDLHSEERNTTEANGDHQLFGYPHSSVQAAERNSCRFEEQLEGK